MTNLLRMEFRRLRISRYPWLTLLFSLLILSAFLFLINNSIQNYKESVESQAASPAAISEQSPGTENVSSADNGVTVEASDDLIDFLAEEDANENLISQQLTGAGYLIFVIVFAAIYFTEPYRNGFIKNFIGLSSNRTGFIFAKYINAILGTVILFIAISLLFIWGAPLIDSELFQVQEIGPMVKFISTHLVAHLAFVGLVLLVATLTRSLPATLLIGIVYSALLAMPILDLISLGAQKAFGLVSDWTIKPYTVMGSIDRLKWGVETNVYTEVLLVSLVYIAITLAASSLILQRKDV
ncbi:MAG TPA: hypothetical protein GXX72_06395 [Clostridiaceae bacterium]|nr:hypothetical protein [Clostridiaceae bacterium]